MGGLQGRRLSSVNQPQTRPPREVALLLRRVMRWAAHALIPEEGAAVERLVSGSPAWAAWWGYALGYVEGGEAARAENSPPPEWVPLIPPPYAPLAAPSVKATIAPTADSGDGFPAKRSQAATAWHCRRCGQMLGLIAGGCLFTRDRGHEVVTRLPARARCRRCGRCQVAKRQRGDLTPRNTA